MTTSTTRVARVRSARGRSTRRRAAAIVIAVLAAALALGLATRSPGAPAVQPGALTPTGEVNAMGMPVLTTPGRATATAAAGGVEVRGARWDLGQVPLNVAVRPTWTLRNTGPDPVTLGEPRPEVIEGCCPGPLTLGTTILAPGTTTTLTFELSMHPGMDGPHELAVHVPVERAEGSDHLVLGVVGDFRD